MFWPIVLIAAVVAGIGGYLAARPAQATTATAPDPAEQIIVDYDPSAFDPARAVSPGDPPVDAHGTSVPPSGGLLCTAVDGWQLTYPENWFTGDGEHACVFFAPWPIVVSDSSETDAPISVRVVDASFGDVVQGAYAEDRAVTAAAENVIAGRKAMVITSMQTIPGWFDEGSAIYEIYLDDGARTFVFSTYSGDGDLSIYGPVLDALAVTLQTSAPLGMASGR